jgi:hypothetical protein
LNDVTGLFAQHGCNLLQRYDIVLYLGVHHHLKVRAVQFMWPLWHALSLIFDGLTRLVTL